MAVFLAKALGLQWERRARLSGRKAYSASTIHLVALAPAPPPPLAGQAHPKLTSVAVP